MTVAPGDLLRDTSLDPTRIVRLGTPARFPKPGRSSTCSAASR